MRVIKFIACRPVQWNNPCAANFSHLYFISVVILWLLPFFIGWKGHSWRVFPRWWSFQHSAAGLFTQRTTVWWDHHLEGEMQEARRQIQEGDHATASGRAFVELAERESFPMGAFGFRTRLDRILNESNRSRMRDEIRERLAAYLLGRFAPKMEDGRWKMEDGRWKMEDGRWQIGDGGEQALCAEEGWWGIGDRGGSRWKHRAGEG